MMTNYTNRPLIAWRPTSRGSVLWRMGASIPLPGECESPALPFELIPLWTDATTRKDATLHTPRFELGFEEAQYASSCTGGCGEDGHRSHYLAHAKRALYHLSYIPIVMMCPEWDSNPRPKTGA